ncbi:MAG: hypothetical protein PUD98_05905, partial [Bacteroidales bacterium]|nr:hypothetical protein [Bacteroidales bacterium]
CCDMTMRLFSFKLNMAFLPAKYGSAKNLNKTVDFGWLRYDEPYTVAIAAPRLCRVVTVLKTTVVLSDGSVVHSDSSLNFSGQQYLRISSEEKKNGHSCLRDADDHSFWYWLI